VVFGFLGEGIESGFGRLVDVRDAGELEVHTCHVRVAVQ
jgi:hypothetical protein